MSFFSVVHGEYLTLGTLTYTLVRDEIRSKILLLLKYIVITSIYISVVFSLYPFFVHLFHSHSNMSYTNSIRVLLWPILLGISASYQC